MDNYTLYGPGGASGVNIGSWVRVDQGGPDFDDQAVLRTAYVENPAVEGGRLVSRQSGVRRFRFPLLLPSGGAGLSLTQLESLLRFNARPGGFIDLQPEHVAAAEAVRFDVLAGRWLPGYVIPHQRITRRAGMLELDVMPYGYWPTWIGLASAVDVKTPFRTAIPVGSIIGDAPAAVRMTVRPTSASWNGFQPTSVAWFTDFVAWGIGGPSQFTTPLRAGHLAIASGWYQQGLNGTYFNETTDADGLSATSVLQVFGASDVIRFKKVAAFPIEAQAFGRYRVFAYARFQPSTGAPIQLTADAVDVDPYWGDPLASANTIATVIPHVGSTSVGGLGEWGYFPSQAHQIVDLGEITVPRNPAGSGLGSQGAYIRVWAGGGANLQGYGSVGSYALYLNGLALVPADGPHGFVPRGLTQPQSLANNAVMYLTIDSRDRRVGLSNDWASASWPQSMHTDGQRWHRGEYPAVTPTSFGITVVSGNRRWTGSAYGAAAHYGAQKAAVTIEYQPRFQFLRGL